MKIWSTKVFDTKTHTVWFVTTASGDVIGPFKTKTKAKAASSTHQAKKGN